MNRPALFVAGAFLLATPLLAQDGVAPLLPNSPEHGIPGDAPGTERWIVHFSERSFDLAAFRNAIRGGAPAADVAAIVADLEARVKADQKNFVDEVKALGGSVVAQWWLINAAAIDIPFAQLGALRKLQNVRFLEADQVWEVAIRTATNANNHNSDYVNTTLGFKGVGVAAGIMDTGCDWNMNGTGRAHRTFYEDGDITERNRLVVNRQVGRLSSDDPHGHGTGVASISAGANWGTSAADHGHAYAANVANYSIANQIQGGGSSSTTMASAWQRMAADKAQYKIVAANLSYGGSPNPLNWAQQALDSAALNADIVCCVAAGNSSASTGGSQGAANGIAVGALNANSHTVASFSSRGPLSGSGGRFYPDIAACGVRTVMARRDSEGSNFTASNTSMASPQVCGAATLLRGAYTKLSAAETKALLLATAIDISQQNSRAPYNTRNAYGMGLLKDDRAFAAAKAGDYASASVTSSQSTWTKSIPVKADQGYAICLTWLRQTISSSSWSNLDLELVDGTTVVATSNTRLNLYEMVRYTSKKAGMLTLRVKATSISGATTQPFSIAWTEAPKSPVAGSFTAYGAGCAGSGKLPSTCMRANESSNLRGASGFTGVRYLLELNAPSALRVEGFAIKLNSRRSSAVSIPAFLYSANGTQPGTVLASGNLAVPSSTGFAKVKLDKVVTIASGRRFFIGFQNPNPTITVGTTNPGVVVPYWRNNGSGGSWVRFSTRGWSYRVNCAGSQGGAIPAIGAVEKPEIGNGLTVTLRGAVENSAAVLLTGGQQLDAAIGGAPGCKLLASPDIFLVYPTGAAGSVDAVLAIPNDKNLIGAIVYHQFAVVDGKANALGAVTSNGGRSIIGGQP